MVAPPEKALNKYFKAEAIMENHNGPGNPGRGRLAAFVIPCSIILVAVVGYVLLRGDNNGANPQLDKREAEQQRDSAADSWIASNGAP